jgi:hypothetical protein
MEMDQLVNRLASELERPRPLPAQVGRHLNSTYGTGREEVGAFLEKQLNQLEEFEIDLTLSPVFTPTITDQAIFAPLLGPIGLTEEQINELIESLVQRPTLACLETDEGTRHQIPLREVTISRYVRRLRLEGSIPDPLWRQLSSLQSAGDADLRLAIARRAAWTPARRRLLERYLQGVTANTPWRSDDALVLLRLVETYQPADWDDFRARLPGWIEAVRREANAATNPKPFFNERVEDLHGGGRDQRRSIDSKAASREEELQSMRRLHEQLAREAP